MASWLAENRQYIFLLSLDLVAFGAWSVATGIAPAGDIRAHIFRTLEFSQGLAAGDYTPIQYHGYAFLAGYGFGYYVVTWGVSSLLASFMAGYQAATIACNLMWLATPLVLSFSAVALADELGMKRSGHRRSMQALLGATILLLPAGALNLTGADPYMLSFSFSLMALVFGLRTKESGRALFGLLAFSALSIYTEGFGYFFMGTVFLALFATRRPVLKVLPVLAAITAFSWVQLLEVASYDSPFIEYLPLFGIGFLTFVGIVGLLVGGYALFSFAIRQGVEERHRAVYVVLAVTLVATLAAVARSSLGWDFGVLNGMVDNILPWRFLFLNVPVLLLVSVYAKGASLVRFPSAPKVLAIMSVLLIAAPLALGTYPVAFNALPASANYQLYAGDRLLVAGPALTVRSSPIAFSPAFGYSTVSGAFSQGDPSFFLLTAYYEWSQYFGSSPVLTNNLLHLTGANELVTSADGAPDSPGDSPGSGGVPYSQAVAVTPILLEAPNATDALRFALFVNLLGKDGFMLDFLTSSPPSEVYGAVVLPGFQGSTPAGLPVYPVTEPQLDADLSIPLAEPFITPPFNVLGPVSNASVDAASSIAASLVSFFHPTYEPLQLEVGPDYYSVSSNSSLPIQLAVSYYPYFSPANYSQNVYHFILLPGPETITWHLPFYEAAAAVSLLATAAVAVSWLSLRRHRLGSPKESELPPSIRRHPVS
jgi:hypothetical protein